MNEPYIHIHTTANEYILNGDTITEGGLSFNGYVNEGEFLAYGSAVAPELSFSFFNDLVEPIDWNVVRYIDYFIDTTHIFRGFVETKKSIDDITNVVCLGAMSRGQIPYVENLHGDIFVDMDIKSILLNSLNKILTSLDTPPFTVVEQFTYTTPPTISVLDTDKLKECTLHDIVRWSAEILGVSVVQEGDRIIIKSPTVNTLVLDESLVFDPLIVNEIDLDITGATVVREVTITDEEGEKVESVEYVAGNNIRPLVIVDNPFSLKNADKTWADNLLSNNTTLKWRPCNVIVDFSTVLNLHLFDLVTVKDRLGQSYTTLITSITFQHDGQINISSVGMDWEQETAVIGSPQYVSDSVSTIITKSNIDLLRRNLTKQKEDFNSLYQTEKDERIQAVNDAIEIAKNSPVTATRITENAIQTSHLSADAVDSKALKVDQALIEKLTLSSLLADTIWTKTLSAKQISGDNITVTNAFVDNLMLNDSLSVSVQNMVNASTPVVKVNSKGVPIAPYKKGYIWYKDEYNFTQGYDIISSTDTITLGDLAFAGIWIAVTDNLSGAFSWKHFKRVSFDSSTQLTILDNQISMTVKEADLISKINAKAGQVLISASGGGATNVLNVTPLTTYIQDSTIKSAHIESLDAGKITVGTLDASKITVKNLSASSINAGTLSGLLYSLNLSTGTTISGDTSKWHSRWRSGDFEFYNGSTRIMRFDPLGLEFSDKGGSIGSITGVDLSKYNLGGSLTITHGYNSVMSIEYIGSDGIASSYIHFDKYLKSNFQMGKRAIDIEESTSFAKGIYISDGISEYGKIIVKPNPDNLKFNEMFICSNDEKTGIFVKNSRITFKGKVEFPEGIIVPSFKGSADHTVVGTGNYIEAVKTVWNQLPAGISMVETRVATRGVAIVQKYAGGNNGSAIVFGYANNGIKKYSYANGAWTLQNTLT